MPLPVHPPHTHTCGTQIVLLHTLPHPFSIAIVVRNRTEDARRCCVPSHHQFQPADCVMQHSSFALLQALPNIDLLVRKINSNSCTNERRRKKSTTPQETGCSIPASARKHMIAYGWCAREGTARTSERDAAASFYSSSSPVAERFERFE